jgi:hypothetical protein
MKTLTLIAVTLACLLTASPALAGGDVSGEPFQPIDAQAMIDACWDLTIEQRSGSNADAREGILLSDLCLEERIADQFEALFDPEVLSREEVAQELKAIRFAYGGLVWKLYNEHEGCPRGHCGTIYFTFHVSEVAHFMEGFLRKVVDQRNEYKR